MRADFLHAADRGLQRRVAAVPVTAQDARDPLQKRGRWYHEALLSAPAHGLVGVGAHLLDPAATQAGPEHGGPRLGGRVIGPGPRPRYCQRSTTSAQRSASAGLPVIKETDAACTASIGCPSIPPWSSSQPNHRCRVAVRLRRSAGSQSFCARRAASSTSPAAMEYSSASSSMPLRTYQPAARRRSTGIRLGTLAFQLRQEHVAEQVMVAVPLPPLVQRHQQQVGPGQIGQGRRGPGPGPAPPRTAARTSAPAPRSGSGTPAAAGRSGPGTPTPRTR